jgi:hypothetical protein
LPSTPEDKEAQKLKRRGLLSTAINTKRHEDNSGRRVRRRWRSFRAGDREWTYDEQFPGVAGKCAARSPRTCFVVTEEGGLYALAATASLPKAAKRWSREPGEQAPTTNSP